MFVMLLIRMSALSLGLSYVSCTTPQQQTQLAALHERMNQMLSALYSSPLLSKVQSTSSEDGPSTLSQESAYSLPAAPAPQIVYVSPPPSYLEAGAQPTDYGYPTTTNPVPRAAWPSAFTENYKYSPPAYSPAPYPYPDYSRAAYPQAPQPAAIPSPLPYPSPYPPQVPYPSSAPFPTSVCPPGYPLAPYAPQIPFPPQPYPAYPSYPPALPYPTSAASSYPTPVPQQYALPAPYPSVSAPFPPPIPSLYPPIPAPYSPNPGPYPVAPAMYPPSSVPVPYPQSFIYPQPLYSSPPAYPGYHRPSEILPQPQYEYTG